jgi:hypothetical protein
MVAAAQRLADNSRPTGYWMLRLKAGHDTQKGFKRWSQITRHIIISSDRMMHPFTATGRKRFKLNASRSRVSLSRVER